MTIFDGGHQFSDTAGLTWLAAQRKGQPATWQLDGKGEPDDGEEAGR